METQKSKWFAFQPDSKTLIVTLLGLAAVGLSFLMTRLPHTFAVSLVFRNLLQVAVIGLIIPVLLMAKWESFKDAGLRFDKPVKYLSVSLLLAVLTAFSILKDDWSPLLKLTASQFPTALYVMVTNIYEVLFFFVFMRFYYEKAFGIVPAIILAALFYSFHHAGFQPEFIKLIIIGIAFISIFRIANHWLICFPMWWAGGVLDVLIGSESVAEIRYGGMTALIILAVIVAMLIWKYPRRGRKSSAQVRN